jgi:hypothetical protein
MALKQAKDIQIGDTVSDRGETFIVVEIRVHRVTGHIVFIDEQGRTHGPYVSDEYLGVNLRTRESLTDIVLSPRSP